MRLSKPGRVWVRLAAFVILLGIVLPPLRAWAATVPMHLAYGQDGRVFAYDAHRRW